MAGCFFVQWQARVEPGMCNAAVRQVVNLFHLSLGEGIDQLHCASAVSALFQLTVGRLARSMEDYFSGDEVVLAWWKRLTPVGPLHPGRADVALEPAEHDAIISALLNSLRAAAQSEPHVFKEQDELQARALVLRC